MGAARPCLLGQVQGHQVEVEKEGGIPDWGLCVASYQSLHF